MKILQAGMDGNIHEFFLDVSDKRFFVLHTNGKSEDTNRVVEALTKDRHHTFDNVWFYSDMLKWFANKPGNSFNGFGVSYSDKFLRITEGTDFDIEDLNMSINGSLAEEMQQLVMANSNIKRTMAYNKVRIRRGSTRSLADSVQDDIHNTGYFAVKRGKSVQDHLQLVDICREKYSEVIDQVENYRIGIKEIEGRTLMEGKSFDFEFPSPIENLNAFVEKMFNSTTPFKLWGLQSKIHDDYFKILAVDLHTGNPIDFEIAHDMMRAYLFKGNCGNTVLRLFTNLQIHYDSSITCPEMKQIACK